MFEDRTEENIKKEMLNSVSDDIGKQEGSFIYDALSPAAIKFAEKYINLDYIAGKLDVENLENGELERFIYQRTGIIRKPATKAITSVLITGQEGAKVSKGDLFGADTVNFISLETKAIDATGQVVVSVQCEEPGTVGNVAANTIQFFPISIPGLISVTNSDPVTNGYEAESDRDLLERYYERIRTPAISGNKYHYLNWAKEVVGVGDARVYPLWAGDNTVKIVIIDSNKQPADEILVSKVQEYIDPNISGLGEGEAPIGAFCTFLDYL